MPDLSEMLTYEDISRLSGVSVATLYVWRARGKLPEPDLLFMRPLWYRATINEWLEQWTPQPS